MNLLAFLDRMPPVLCRLVARHSHGRRGLSVRALASASGLSKATISELSPRATWKGVKVDVAERFAAACGVDFWRLDGQRKFLRKAKWEHVAGANAEQGRMYARLLRVRR